ncbi:hypothetical protein K439DRAFT_1335132 [Ramaria rubella]|nr:hypothetical protein K439DRAFT_1335132 [Ramaria rubella]
MSFTSNAREYETRRQQAFAPPTVTLKELRDVVPKHVFRRSTVKGVYYVVRSVVMALALYKLAVYIDPFAASLHASRMVAFGVRWGLWVIYWLLQSLAWGGLWTLGHEAGHGSLSPYHWFNHALGFTMHTFLLIPYFSWRWTHHVHHKASASLERDENYVPRLRSHFSLPKAESATKLDYHELLEEAPFYTLVKIVFMTVAGFQVYLGFNTMGSPSHPPGTNHFNPRSSLFNRNHWHLILISDLGLSFMIGLLTIWAQHHGLAAFVKYYFIPYILANHWVVILTFLQHSDPTIPHYRKGQWNFVRGALATVDRPFLGWAGRFFLHNISHDHTAHHLFSNIPFYNLPVTTKSIKPVLKDHYSYDSTYTFYALWRSFTECVFVEDDGDVLFYKNRRGQVARRLQISEPGQSGSTDDNEIEQCIKPDTPATYSCDVRAQSKTTVRSPVVRRVGQLARRAYRDCTTPIPSAM